MHQLKVHDGLSHVLSTRQCTAYFTVLASSFSSPAVLPALRVPCRRGGNMGTQKLKCILRSLLQRAAPSDSFVEIPE